MQEYVHGLFGFNNFLMGFLEVSLNPNPLNQTNFNH